MKDLTERQTEVYDFISSQIKARGFPPTETEIAENFGYSSQNARQHINALVAKGILEKEPGVQRGLRVKRTDT